MSSDIAQTQPLVSCDDAFLLLSFGGPEGPDDVMPFLRNVTRGRGIPDERLAEVAEHYYHFGGKSPINEQNRALLRAIEKELVRAEMPLPMYWGNRNWDPFLADAMQQMRERGVKRAFAFLTSGYGSYSARDQYLEDIANAQTKVEGAPEILVSPLYFDHPRFIAAHSEILQQTLAQTTIDPARTRLVFVAHSIPVGMHHDSGGVYEKQLRYVATRVAAEAGQGLKWDLVWQSRSGAPHIPWLEPDINDHLVTLTRQGASNVVVCPIGFISDHLEVKWDLDTEAAATAHKNQLGFLRAATPSTHPEFVRMVCELTRVTLEDTGRRSLPSK